MGLLRRLSACTPAAPWRSRQSSPGRRSCTSCAVLVPSSASPEPARCQVHVPGGAEQARSSEISCIQGQGASGMWP